MRIQGLSARLLGQARINVTGEYSAPDDTGVGRRGRPVTYEYLITGNGLVPYLSLPSVPSVYLSPSFSLGADATSQSWEPALVMELLARLSRPGHSPLV